MTALTLFLCLFSVKFEHISHFFVVFVLLTMSMYLFGGNAEVRQTFVIFLYLLCLLANNYQHVFDVPTTYWEVVLAKSLNKSVILLSINNI